MAAVGRSRVAPVLQIPTGVTPTERYLKRLCDRTFLSLWSYPGIFRDQRGPGRHGKEVCDLLVVFENHVIIFSDKCCEFLDSGNLTIDWQRWFRRAVEQSARQIWGAERWIREHPDRLFIGRQCTHRFPLPIEDPRSLQFHRIVVAHNSSSRCRREFNGGSGTLILQSDLVGQQHYTSPFHVGQIDSAKGFVHVLDDVSLDLLLRELDTVADLTEYLERKERFLASYPAIWVPGEEELLAIYLQNVDAQGQHDFVLPVQADHKLTFIAFEEGYWASFQQHRDRLARIQADRISYCWDALIEKFSHHIRAGTLEEPISTHIAYHEHALRRLAREPRTLRRFLARQLLDLVLNTPPDKAHVRVQFSQCPDDTCYVFLVVPPAPHSDLEQRRFRRDMLHTYCKVVKLIHPTVRHLVGIATESSDVDDRSEDLVYLDTISWSETDEQHARDLQRMTGILQNPRIIHGTEKEYPDA